MVASHAELGSKPVRLVLVDDHEMVIEGLKAMLAAFKDRVQVVGQAGVPACHAVLMKDRFYGLCRVRRLRGCSGSVGVGGCGGRVAVGDWIEVGTVPVTRFAGARGRGGRCVV